MWFHDAFICHASEDKETFVRPLAERLRAEHLEIWYDEFSLSVGDSLRRSIDRGLVRSRFGIVVLSKAFFAKSWTQRELDGLVAREMANGAKVVLPIWHGISKDDVLAYSPPLADTVAIDSSIGLDLVVRRLAEAIRPTGSPLIVARDRLIELGVQPPVVTDEWWLDVVEATNREPVGGFVPQQEHWDRWSFPLPPDGGDANERGERIAWTALMLGWTYAAEDQRVCQITHPSQVLAFIRAQVGLADACHKYPHFLAAYAPQLTIPGFGGEFEDDFKQLAPRYATLGAWLHSGPITEKQAAVIACEFVQGELGGPPCKLYETIDYIFWVLSDASRWMPDRIRQILADGFKEWTTWSWDRYPASYEEFGLEAYPFMGELQRAVFESKRSALKPTKKVLADIAARADGSVQLLGLPERPEVLAQRFLDAQFIEHFIQRERKRKS